MTEVLEGLEIKFVLITPEIAAEWLGRNDINRKLRQQQVDKIAGMIRRGEWVVNGDTIKINREGQILDGQHRLWAIVEAGIPVGSLVVFGLENEAQATVDTGTRRNLADALKLAGRKNTNNLAATLNWIHLQRLGETALRNPTAVRLSSAQAFRMLEDEGPGIEDALNQAAMIRNAMNSTLAVSIIAACLYWFREIDAEDAAVFWSRVGEGTGMKKNDPCYMLREACTKNAKRRNKYPSLMMLAYCIKSWNAFRNGREYQTLVWKMGGARPEPFPQAI